MADSRPLLDRLLHTPDLAKIVPHLQPEVLHRVIESCGLEDCAEVVALATPEQISRVLDLDIWRVRRPGADEEFDVHRFGVWLEVLMEAGPAIAAEKLSGLELSLVVVGLARHVAVFDHAAVSPFSTLDGEVVGGRTWNRGPVLEIGGYDVAARETSAWETIGELLTFLAAERPEYFTV